MSIDRFILFLMYAQDGDKPSDISDARWKAMLAQYNNSKKSDFEKFVPQEQLTLTEYYAIMNARKLRK